MNRRAMWLLALLAFAVSTLWIEARWAWSAFQLGMIALAMWRLTEPRPFVPSYAMALLAVAAAWPWLQLALGTTLSRGETWCAALDWITFLLVFAMSQEILEPAIRRRFLSGLSVSGLVLAAVATLQKYSSAGKVFWLFPSGYSADVLGPFVNHNQYAAWAELLIPVSIYLAVTDARRRPLHGAAAAALFASVVASASRAGFVLGAAEVLAVITALAARRAAPRRAMALALAQFLILAAAACAVAGWQGLAERMGAKRSEALRVDALRASVQMLQDRPWTGTGVGTWALIYPQYSSFDGGVRVNQAHNDWAQWAAEGGVPLVLTLAIFACLLWKSAIQSIYGMGTVAFLLHSLVDYPMQQRPGLSAWFFAMAGVTMAWNATLTRQGDGLFRRTRGRTVRFSGGDPARIQTSGTSAASGPVHR